MSIRGCDLPANPNDTAGERLIEAKRPRQIIGADDLVGLTDNPRRIQDNKPLARWRCLLYTSDAADE